jgi:hypothetical protein
MAGVVAPTVSAQDPLYRKVTYLTFSGPIAVPGMTLPAGTYRFQLADPDSSRRVVQIASQDGTKNFGIFLSMQNQRLEASDKPVIMFQETPAGAPHAVKAWFYPGERGGYEFVYPRTQAVKIAQANHQAVLAMDDSSAGDAYKSASVTHVDASGQSTTLDDGYGSSAANTVSTTPDANRTPPGPAPATTSAATSTRQTSVGTAGQAQPAAPRTARARTLPQTASQLGLLQLLSALCLVGAASVHQLRKRLPDNA